MKVQSNRYSPLFQALVLLMLLAGLHWAVTIRSCAGGQSLSDSLNAAAKTADGKPLYTLAVPSTNLYFKDDCDRSKGQYLTISGSSCYCQMFMASVESCNSRADDYAAHGGFSAFSDVYQSTINANPSGYTKLGIGNGAKAAYCKNDCPSGYTCTTSGTSTCSCVPNNPVYVRGCSGSATSFTLMDGSQVVGKSGYTQGGPSGLGKGEPFYYCSNNCPSGQVCQTTKDSAGKPAGCACQTQMVSVKSCSSGSITQVPKSSFSRQPADTSIGTDSYVRNDCTAPKTCAADGSGCVCDQTAAKASCAKAGKSFDANSCSCTCDPKAKSACDITTHKWDDATCSCGTCLTSLVATCTNQRLGQLDPATCECTCSKTCLAGKTAKFESAAGQCGCFCDSKQACSGARSVWSEDSCSCVCPALDPVTHKACDPLTETQDASTCQCKKLGVDKTCAINPEFSSCIKMYGSKYLSYCEGNFNVVNTYAVCPSGSSCQVTFKDSSGVPTLVACQPSGTGPAPKTTLSLHAPSAICVGQTDTVTVSVQTDGKPAQGSVYFRLGDTDTTKTLDASGNSFIWAYCAYAGHADVSASYLSTTGSTGFECNNC
ncbi:Uncharacterised protein [uncultured archaeon]|nr:Uncharacterised protein [uncultured archaeon]